MLTFQNFLLESKKSEGIICYHVSNKLNHMLNSDFKLEYADDFSLFGHAIYFSSSPNIVYFPSNGGKKYICKFSIILEEPILDMNKEISIGEANTLLHDFLSISKIKDKTLDSYFFKKDFDDGVQYGSFFEKIANKTSWDYNKHFRNFIQKYLGFNSFKYYQNDCTDFRTELGSYGTAYGLYNPKNIKYVDGPF